MLEALKNKNKTNRSEYSEYSGYSETIAPTFPVIANTTTSITIPTLPEVLPLSVVKHGTNTSKETYIPRLESSAMPADHLECFEKYEYKPPKDTTPQLSESQLLVYNKYLEGKNVFMSGPGGVGKSYLIKIIAQHAYRSGVGYQVCALTGCAAITLNCKAVTVHKFAGICLGNGTIESNVNKILGNKFACMAWRNVKLLIVDEVSMMSRKLFDMLDAIAKAVRKSSKAFGGIQMLFSGDMYQLPPVPTEGEPTTEQFCFESDNWFRTFSLEDHVSMQTIFRQTDEIFKQVLNQLRVGYVTPFCVEYLLQHTDKEYKGLVLPVKLFPIRSRVDMINKLEYGRVQGVEYTFKSERVYESIELKSQVKLRMKYSEKEVNFLIDYVKTNMNAVDILKLKVGVQVMCVVNLDLDAGICNGSQGIVLSVDIPLKIVKVQFNNGVIKDITQYFFKSEELESVGILQIPLIICYALTIHKAQGCTLDTAELDLGEKIFENGQIYVALSRVKSIDGVYIKAFDPKRVSANSKVIDFYSLFEG